MKKRSSEYSSTKKNTSAERYLEKNIRRFALFNPQSAIYLPYADHSHLKTCQTKTGELNIKFPKRNSYLHSPKGAHEEAAKWFSELPLENIEVLFIYGIGLGYIYEAAKGWLKKNKKRRLIFLEDDLPILKLMLETKRGSQIIDDSQVQIRFLPHHQKQSVLFDQVIDQLAWDFLMKPSHIICAPYYQNQKSRQDIFSNLHHRLSSEQVCTEGIVHEFLTHGAVFFRSFYRNMLKIDKSHLGNSFFGKFKKIPAIICGAGPSLNKNVKLLKELQDRALIFAGGSALNALDALKIFPHFGASIDPNATQYQRLKDLNDTMLSIPFFYRSRMYYKAFQLLKGHRLYITGSSGYDVSTWFEKALGIEQEPIEEGYNVVALCVEIAHALGCKPIILLGMDLAFSHNAAYASGVRKVDDPLEKEAIAKHSDLDEQPVEKKDIHGKKVYTLWKWIIEARWMTAYAKSHPKAKVINATEGGLGFEGIPNIPLKTVIQKFLTKRHPIQAKLNRCLTKAKLHIAPENVHTAMLQWRCSLIKCIEHIERYLIEIDRLTKEVKDGMHTKQELRDIETTNLALIGMDLAGQEAYQYGLLLFDKMYSRYLHHTIWLPMLRQRRAANDQQRTLKRLKMEQNKYNFLKRTAATHLFCLDQALQGL